MKRPNKQSSNTRLDKSQVLSNNILIHKAVRGDVNWLGDLYLKYLNDIYRFIFFRLGGNTLEAEDLTEISFIRVFNRLKKKNLSGDDFRNLIYRTATNLINEIQGKNHGNFPRDPLDLMEDDAQTTKSKLQPKRNIQDLASAISNLDNNYQNVIILRFINRLSQSETAAILETSEDYVRVVQYHGLKQLYNWVSHG